MKESSFVASKHNRLGTGPSQQVGAAAPEAPPEFRARWQNPQVCSSCSVPLNSGKAAVACGTWQGYAPIADQDFGWLQDFLPSPPFSG